MRHRRSIQRRHLEPWKQCHLLGKDRYPPLAVSCAGPALAFVAAHVVAQFRLHRRAAHDLAPQVTPAVIGLDVRHFQGFVHPLTQPLSDLLPLGVGSLAAACPGGFVEQWLADLPTILDVLQESLLDEMFVDRDPPQALSLRDLRSEHEAPMTHDLLDNDLVPVPSLSTAASDETCRPMRARAAIASARSIFTMASTDRDLTKTH
jgi:hypothetical protein